MPFDHFSATKALGGFKAMLDAIFLIVTTVLFVLMGAYTHACDRL